MLAFNFDAANPMCAKYIAKIVKESAFAIELEVDGNKLSAAVPRRDVEDLRWFCHGLCLAYLRFGPLNERLEDDRARCTESD